MAQKKEKLPRIGDIIRSSKFTYGEYNSEFHKGKLVAIEPILIDDTEEKQHPVSYSHKLTDKERVEKYRRTGKLPREYEERVVDLSAYDETRGLAKFVVEQAEMDGGTGPDVRDPYPDGWHVKAIRLKVDGSYNKKGEVIEFYVTGCFRHTVEVKDIEILGTMKNKLPFFCRRCGHDKRKRQPCSL